MRLKGKIAAAAAVLAFAFGGAGVVLAANASPSAHASPAATAPHPASSPNSEAASGNSTDNFGSKKVQTRLAWCKARRPTTGGDRGIGQCVSSWVTTQNPGHTGGHAAPTNTGH